MRYQKVLLITGAGRGMGVDIARALAAGYAVVPPAAIRQKVEPGIVRTELLTPGSTTYA